MKLTKQVCERKLDLFYFSLKLQSALLERLSMKDISSAEEKYAELKNEYFHIKTLISSSLVDASALDKSIESNLRKINQQRIALLEIHSLDFNSQLLVEIKRKFVEFQSIVQVETADTSAVKEVLNVLIREIKANAGNVCDMKNRLLFFELNTIDTYIFLLEHLTNLVDVESAGKATINIQLLKQKVREGKEQYRKLDDLFYKSVKYQQLLIIDTDLENNLGRFYGVRLKIRQDFSRLFLLLKEKFVLPLRCITSIENALFSVNDEMEKIICKINGLKDISLGQVKNFETMLATVKQMTTEFYVMGMLQDQYDAAYRFSMVNLLLQKWLQELQQRELGTKNKYPQTTSVARVLVGKQLIGDVKAACYESIYQSIKHVDILTYLNKKLTLNASKAPNRDSLIEVLRKESNQLRQAVEKIENSLGDYAWSLALPVFLTRLATHNWYFRIAETYVRSMHELTTQDALRNLPIIGAHLNETQLKVLSALQTTLFLGIEIGVARVWGISYSLLSSLIEFVMPNITTLSNAGHYLGMDEIDAINFLPSVKWLAGLQTQCLLYVYLTNDKDLLFPASSYMVATALNKLVLSTLYFLSPRFSTNNFIRFMASNSAFLFGGWLWKDIYPAVKTFFSRPTDQELLFDSTLCEKYKMRCKEVALNTLELDETASVQEVKEQFKKLAFTHHPDKSAKGYTGLFFENIHLAKRRAIECMDSESLSFSASSLAKGN